MQWQEIWSWVGKGAAFLGLPALVSALVAAWYKNRLQAANEQMRTELQQALKEHEIRFSALHARRIGVLGKLYRRMVYLNSAYMDMTKVVLVDGDLPIEERERSFAQRWVAFRNYFNLNRIWLDRDICDEIDDYARQLQSGADAYGMWKYYAGMPSHLQDMGGRIDEMSKLHKQGQETRSPLSHLLERLIDRFRELIGPSRIAQLSGEEKI